MRGSCLCGAVRFEAEPAARASHACHCDMCRAWGGVAFVGVEVRPGEIRFEDEDAIAAFRSSDWAERGFCRVCGSHLFYRLTLPGPDEGVIHMALGLFEDQDAFPLVSEIYIDRKPSAYAFAGERRRRTKAEVEAETGGGVE